MSILKPAAKVTRKLTQPAATQTTLVALEKDMEEENIGGLERVPTNPLSSPVPFQTEKKKKISSSTKPKHPRGHKVESLQEIWRLMDAQPYVRLTDTWSSLWDVWLQPLHIESEVSTSTIMVQFLEIVYGAHIKYRTASHQISCEDFVKMCYVKDRIGIYMSSMSDISFDDWVVAHQQAFEKINEHPPATNAEFCEFLLTTMDNEETRKLTGIGWNSIPGVFNCGIFIRKSCCHSYKDKNGNKKFENISMVKCSSVKGAFDYVIEGRLFVLPHELQEITSQ